MQLVRVEGGQIHPLDAGQPEQFGQQRPQRMAPVQVVGAVGRHHEQPLGAEPGQQEAQQVAGGGISPVQVLDHEEDGGDVTAELGQCGRHRIEQGQALDGLVGLWTVRAPGPRAGPAPAVPRRRV